ncbi:MAG: CehA/McbA family metallohydrolase [Myxococcales bacterium]|nr:CehA/McbA family metallohydrolase [Myxococcales bacterium]
MGRPPSELPRGPSPGASSSRRGRVAPVVVALAAAAVVGGCRKQARPLAAATLTLRITDGLGGPPVAARVLFWDGDAPLPMGRAELYGGVRQATGSCQLGPRAIGTVAGVLVPDGVATLPVGGGDDCEPSPALPLGRYRVTAWRDFEHELWDGEVTLAAGAAARLDIALERAWQVDGALVADLHVHAARSNDSGVPDTLRAMSQACAGIAVTALSDHASNGDLDAAITAAGLDGVLASIASNELGSDGVHLGVYPVPVAPGPRGGSPDAAALAAMDPAALMAWGRAQPGRPIVQVNHPRFRMYALFDNAGWDGVRWPPPFPLDFDAVEVLAGHTAFNAPGDRRSDQGVRDFYALIAHGAWVTGVGTSDTHHLNGVLDGVARTYVLYDDPRAATVAPFDEAAFVAQVRARRAVATTGPWLDVEVVDVAGGASAGPGQTVIAASGRVRIDVELAQARHVHTDAIRVIVGGVVVRTEPVPRGVRRHRLTLEVPITGPTWIGVDAGGDEPLPTWLTGTYQVEKHRPGVVPFAIINPIRVALPAAAAP